MEHNFVHFSPYSKEYLHLLVERSFIISDSWADIRRHIQIQSTYLFYKFFFLSAYDVLSTL